MRKVFSFLIRYKWLLVVLAVICAVIAVPSLLFLNRPPVLVVTDVPFVALYGEKRLKQQQFAASSTLLRRVKPILVADGASPDILIFAITEAAARPFCVLFPRSQAQAAVRYHEQFPEIPVALLNGAASASGLPAPDGVLCVYTTDRETDLYRAGFCAGILGTADAKTEEEEDDPEKMPPIRKSYVLWQDRSVQGPGREIFTRGLKEQDPEAAVVFVSSSAQVPDVERITCAVLTGAGGEFFEKNPKMPIILFSWLNPLFVAREVAVLFDDSPWALAAEAAQMAAAGQAEGMIPSKPLILVEKTPDDSMFEILKKSAKKVP